MRSAMFNAAAIEVPCITGHWPKECIFTLAGIGAFLSCFAPYVWPDISWCEDVHLILVLVAGLLCYQLAVTSLPHAKKFPKESYVAPSLALSCWRAIMLVMRVWQRRRILLHEFNEVCDKGFRKFGIKTKFQYYDEPSIEDFHRYPKDILPNEVVAYRSSSVELGLWLPGLMRPRDTGMASIPEDDIIMQWSRDGLC